MQSNAWRDSRCRRAAKRISLGACARGFPELRRKQAGGHPKISAILAAVTNSQAIKVTKRSTIAGDFDVSEQQPVSDSLGDVVGAGPTAPNPPDATPAPMAQGPAQDSAQYLAKPSLSVESPKIAPEPGEADKAKDTPKAEITKPETAQPAPVKAETPQIQAKAEAPKTPGQILIMPREQGWNGDNAGSKAQSAGGGMSGGRRVAALAAVVVLAAAAGAIGGVMATAGVGHVAGDKATVASNRALEDTISRIDTEVAALRT